MNSKAWIWAAFLPRAVVLGAATLGPVGHWGRAPGTLGSMAGLLLYTAFIHHLSLPLQILSLLALTYLAIGFCGEAEARLFKRDPGEIILDEFIAMPWCFLGLGSAMEPRMWLYMLLGFLLFRFFDIVKPLGIRKLQALPGGVGVVLDDLAAAAATCLCLHLLVVLKNGF